MSHDQPTLTPDHLTVDTASLDRERAALVRLAVDSHVTIETAAPANLVSLLRNTVEGRGYRLRTNTIPTAAEADSLAGTLRAEATRTDAITLRERFVPKSVRLLAGVLAATAVAIALAAAAVEFVLIAVVLAGFAIGSPYADARTPATATYPVQLDLSVTSEPIDTAVDPSVPTDSRFSGRPAPLAVTVEVVSYAPFDRLPESGLRTDVDGVIDALRRFSDA